MPATKAAAVAILLTAGFRVRQNAACRSSSSHQEEGHSKEQEHAQGGHGHGVRPDDPWDFPVAGGELNVPSQSEGPHIDFHSQQDGADTKKVYHMHQPFGPIAPTQSADSKQGSHLSDLAMEVFLNVAAGTGASSRSTGNKELDAAIVQRVRFQDQVVAAMLLTAYMVCLLLGANYVYRQASNNSPILYYADPRQDNLASEAEDSEEFLDAFNQVPKGAQLQISGFLPPPSYPDSLAEGMDWVGSQYRCAFSFALDLSPWLVRDPVPSDSGSRSADSPSTSGTMGVTPEDVAVVQDFLSNNTNDLATLEIHKQVAWPDWEELATNIKHQIRQGGFDGVVCVRHSAEEIVTIYKNKAWANFMHNRSTKVLCALSVIGWFLYQPYMWVRLRPTIISSRYRVSVSISNYWPLIADKVGPEGFDSNANSDAR